jgi:hypothetical protein
MPNQAGSKHPCDRRCMSLFRPSRPPNQTPAPLLRQVEDPFDRRTGADRRRQVEKRNGLAVLMAGCSLCDRIAPSPIEMNSEGWIMEWDELGLVRITCPDHNKAPDSPDGDALPDYIVPLDNESV